VLSTRGNQTIAASIEITPDHPFNFYSRRASFTRFAKDQRP
jgi:hypothetical protein